MRTFEELAREVFTEDEIEKMNAEVVEELAALDLVKYRKAIKITQAAMAKRVGISQSQLANLERRHDNRFSSIRNLVEKLGHRLEVTIVVDELSIPIYQTPRAASPQQSAPLPRRQRRPARRHTRPASADCGAEKT